MSLQTIAGAKMPLFLDHGQVRERVGKRSKTKTWRQVKNDEFPPPAQDGGINKWPDDEIAAYIRWRIALRDGTTTKWSAWWRAECEANSQAAA